MTWLHAVLPSFISTLIWPELKERRRIHPTSYLDGLRGLASILVFFCHYTEENHHYFTPTYGLNDDHISSWIQLPFIRIIFSGRPMVHIFFVISGFVLSAKPLKAIIARDYDNCYNALSSSAFRRPFRLYGPCIVSTFLVALMIQGGWIYQPAATIGDQLWAWADAVFHSITWPWAWDTDLRPGYDVHLWSIPIEFVHSMLLFLTILMLARVRAAIRQVTVVILLAYFMASGRWAAFEFIAGMLLAEIHIIRRNTSKQYESVNDRTSRTERLIENSVLHYGVHALLFTAAIFVGCWPNERAADTPGIRTLLAHTPVSFPVWDDLTPQKFWFALQAVIMVWTCGELSFVRRFLEGHFAQYCGDISYAIYIVHGPVLDMLQSTLAGSLPAPAWGQPGGPGFQPETFARGPKGWIGTDTALQRNAAWLVGLILLAPIVVWCADLFWRHVDVPVVHAARRLESICLDSGIDASSYIGHASHARSESRLQVRQQSRTAEMAALA